jgi:hypothetical protein
MAGAVAVMESGRRSPIRIVRRARAGTGLAVALTLALAGCSASAEAFTADHRLHFVSPRSRATVSLPVTLNWRMRDFTVVGPGAGPPSSRSGYFALFVDRAPVRPGETLRAVAGRDRVCLHTPGCPDQAYLSDRGVYTSTSESLTLTQIASRNSYQQKQLHEVTIVPLDTAGHRIGESAWSINFWMHQRSLG